MARMTPEQDALVIRLVYDGPPRSGKTTSLSALAGGMARSIFSPQEAEGRTQYFDWLEYVGGSFDGIPIRCQILSVPGQPELAARRRALLAEADALVFVTNSAAEQMTETAEHLGDLRSFLASRPFPRPGLVVQANHRDRPDALPLIELRGALGLDGLALVESVATEGQGIREAFVLAVRLALDRARELRLKGALPIGRGDTDDPGALLARLQTAEHEPTPGATRIASPPEVPLLDLPHPAGMREVSRTPRLPDSSAPSGRVWPPIDGRMLLHSATTPGAVPRRGNDGSWWLRTGVWHFHSASVHEFENLDDAKKVLLYWAQRHAGRFERLSPQRCLALTETGLGTWRLWQVVHAEESLRQRLRVALRESSPAGVAMLLCACAGWLLEARSCFSLAPTLPCRLEVIGEFQGRPAYIGLLPPPSWEPPAAELSIPEVALVQRELQPLLEAARAARRWPDEELLAALTLPAGERMWPPAVAEALTAILATA